jgi:hypothetical protein
MPHGETKHVQLDTAVLSPWKARWALTKQRSLKRTVRKCLAYTAIASDRIPSRGYYHAGLHKRHDSPGVIMS